MFDVPSGLVCDYDDYCYDGHYDENPDYFDYDDPGDFNSYPDVYGFIEPDDHDLYHDIHGPDGCGVYCISWGEAGGTSYWAGVDKCDDYEGNGVLPRSQIYDSAVALHRTGSDQTFNEVFSIVGPVGPGNETGSVADASGDVIVMSSECQEVDIGTLDKIRMWEINPPVGAESALRTIPVSYFVRRCLSPTVSNRFLSTYAYTIGNWRELLVSHGNVSRLCVGNSRQKLTQT